MSSATDTFAAWLDVLVDTLDEPGLTGEQIAARLHLSRFHLDRVVSAAAGEAPRTLRRRVLLERAAFRLAASRRSVLDVAVEAGYGSHEAFTRAFRRAYGRAPTAWRERPGAIRVEAGNGIHFHPPAGIRLGRGRARPAWWGQPPATTRRRRPSACRPDEGSPPWTCCRRWSSTMSGSSGRSSSAPPA